MQNAVVSANTDWLELPIRHTSMGNEMAANSVTPELLQTPETPYSSK
jgi:hypothetical protein